MCDMYRWACFSQKNFYKWNRYGFAMMSLSPKTAHGVDSEDNIPGTVVSKEGYVDYLLGYERTHHNWFLWKRCNYK